MFCPGEQLQSSGTAPPQKWPEHGGYVSFLTPRQPNAAQDVITQDGVHAIRITPEAGAVKGGSARLVPIHKHVIAQGFLKS